MREFGKKKVVVTGLYDCTRLNLVNLILIRTERGHPAKRENSVNPTFFGRRRRSEIIIFHVVQGPFIEDFKQCVTYGLHGTLAGTTLRILRFVFIFLLPLAISRRYLRFHRNHNLSKRKGYLN